MGYKVQVIAEVGVNHNGQIDLAFKLIDVALNAGADVVKFHASIPKLNISKVAVKADYQLSTTDPNETQLEMCEKMTLSFEELRKLKTYAEKREIKFLATPFDIVSIDYLDKLGLDCIKVPSGDITNLPYLRRIGELNKEVIMSTGMSELSEITDALNILNDSGTERSKIMILHCNTEYPTPYDDVNLRAMLTIRDELGVRVGYSDHTLGIEVPIAAVALGAEVIEKHITLDRNMQGPDHSSSLEPDELKAMVNAIRNIEKAMGDGVKRPSLSEKENMPIARKSIIAATKIKKGEILSEKNLLVKRPATGISPMNWDKVIGKVANKDYEEDDLIELGRDYL